MKQATIVVILAVLLTASCSNPVGHGSDPESGEEVAKVLVTQDADRLYVSVINVANFNFRWDPYPRVEITGDLKFDISRDGVNYPSVLPLEDIELDYGLIWMQSGSGVALAPRKFLLRKRFQLTKGCYDVVVHVTNRAAVAAFDPRDGLSGPIVEAKSDRVEVCFQGDEDGEGN